MQNPIVLLAMAIFAPLVCGVLSLALPRKAIGARVGLIALGPLASMGLLVASMQPGGTFAGRVHTDWMPALQLNFTLNADSLGMFFALLVTSIGFLIVLYARGYFGPDKDSLYRFYPSLMLFMTAMVGVALSDNFMLLLLFWEMTSISSFLLIGWERDDSKAVKSAMQAFVVTGMGGLAMMGGLILLGLSTRQLLPGSNGIWTFTDLHQVIQSGTLTQLNTSTVVAFGLIFLGAAAKSAQFPLHFWLPGAMAAPTPVSAYLHSATMVKAGVYLIGRLWPIFADQVWLWPAIIIPLGATTMVYGAFIALQKHDLKQIFAYTTVSQLGLLMTMYGLSAFKYEHHHHLQPNLIWDVTQILNHALYKAPLFILAGAIGHVATRNLPELRGFFWRNRTSAIMGGVLLLAAYGMAAGPGTVSFTAKEFFFYQIYHAKSAIIDATGKPWLFWALVSAGIATGMFNVAIFVRLATTLLGRAKAADEHHDDHAHSNNHAAHGAHGAHGAHAAHGHGGHDDHHETGLWPAFLWIPGLVIVAFQYVGGLVPGAWTRLFGWLEPAVSINYFDTFPLTWDAHWGLPLQMSFAAMGLGLVLGFLPVLRGVYRDPFDHAYPGFYHLFTKVIGPRAFGSVQTGNAGHYVAFLALAIVGLFAWSIGFDITTLRWPDDINLMSEWNSPHNTELLMGLLLTGLVCFAALLMPVVQDRAARVLVLGTCGFAVTGVYYLYKAPDLALTQISIEIVSLVLFLLVLSLLPNESPRENRIALPKLLLASCVGLVMFWLTLTSSVGAQPTMPYFTAQGQPLAHLGEYFLRNTYHGVDAHSFDAKVPGVVARPMVVPGEAHEGPVTQGIHTGGGGNNPVNVILVDFRGFDTMGEITVLGLAALGVWTLLRRRKGSRSENRNMIEPASDHDSHDFSRIDIPEPTGGPDPEDSVLRRVATHRSV